MQNTSDISWVPFYYHGLTLISARVSSYFHYKVREEITYPFLNFNGATVVNSLGSNEQYSSIGSDNGLVPSMRQAIIWTNDG